MNLPNKLTLLRIFMVPFFVAAMLIEFPFHYFVALLLFVVASITDLVDGKIARKYNLITNFGKFADPLADKILVTAAMICLLQQGLCDGVLIIIVLFREFCISAIRLVAASEGKVVAANIWGKVKTVTQMIALITILALQFGIEVLSISAFGVPADIIALCGTIVFWVGEILLWISTIFTIISGVIYVWDNRKFIADR